MILDGRALAAELRTELLARTSALRDAGIHPRLVIVFVGENESSVAYVRNLMKTGQNVGIDVTVEKLPERASSDEVRASLDRLRDDASVHGVMLQQPLPPHLAIREIADAIPSVKTSTAPTRPTRVTSPSAAAPNSSRRPPPP